MTVVTDPRKTGVALATAIGSGTFAQMKAVTGMADGDSFLVTNYGRGGSMWHYSATLTEWFPMAATKVYENTALITGAAQTADQLLVAIPLEAKLLSSKVFRLLISLGKTGAVDAIGTATNVRLGTAGSTADTSIATANLSTVLSAANRSAGLEFWFRMASATSVNKLGGVAQGAWLANAGTAGLLNAATTVSDVSTQTMQLSITTTMGGTTDSPQLGYVAVEIQP